MAVATETLRPLTIDDLAQFPDDGLRREILLGELIVTPAPTPAHQRLVGRLDRLIGGYVDKHELGEVFPAPVDVRLAPHDVVEPDLVFVSTAREAIISDRFIDGTPDLIVEVLSPSTRRNDLVKKQALYLRARIPEYWIVDPDQQSLQILKLEGDVYVPATLSDGLLRSAAVPGLVVDPVKLFSNIRQSATASTE